jgi:type III secretion protein Q
LTVTDRHTGADVPPATLLQVGPLEHALPFIHPQYGMWSRVVHDMRLGLLLKKHGLDVVLSPATTPPDSERYAIELTDGDHSLRIEVGHCEHPALAMTGRLPASEGVQRLAALALLAQPLRLLHELGLGRWEPTRLTRVDTQTPVDAGDPLLSPWVVVRREGHCLCLLRFGGAPLVLCRALAALTREQQPSDEHTRSWRIPGRIVLHQHAYEIALMSTLVIGDVLLMQPVPGGKTGLPVRARWGAAAGRCIEVKASLRGSQLQVQATPHLPDDETLPEEPDSEVQSAETLAELSIAVRFEIETVAMTLSDLAAIGPGYVIELNSPIAASVIRLVACGQVVGHAELVAVGGQLGARITHMVER